MKLKIGNILICSSYILFAILKMYLMNLQSLDSYDAQATTMTVWAVILLIQFVGLLFLSSGLSKFDSLSASVRAIEVVCSILMIVIFFLNVLIKHDCFTSKMGMYGALACVIVVSVVIIIVSLKLKHVKILEDLEEIKE